MTAIVGAKRAAKTSLAAACWERAVFLRRKAATAARLIRQDTASLGLTAALILLADMMVPRRKASTAKRQLLPIPLSAYRFPVYFRIGGSDAKVIRDVLSSEAYACVAQEKDVRYIIDCGANIGCTTFYLLNRYRNAQAIVVEPDPDNMRVCRKNLRPIADRVHFVERGLWSQSLPMVVEHGRYCDGLDWAIQVRAARAGEKPDFVAVTIPELMKSAGFPRIDILKVDIEASEIEVFGDGRADWLRLVRNLVIELHGPECEVALSQAVKPFAPAVARSGELTHYRFGLKDQSN